MIAAIALLVIAIAWRLLGLGHRDDFAWMHNFAPLSAIALCGALALPRRVAFALPLVALLATDIILNRYYGVGMVSLEMLARYAVLAAIAGAGWWLRRNPQALAVLGASALCSVIFYFVTNTASWMGEPAYAKTFAGWAQALTGGLPGYPPTLVFFRNTLLSDVIFTALFLLCTRAALAPSRHATEAEAPRWT
ncbi:MAG: DUF6580 family putative transport protein [Chthoniobacteraceae bacterium]